MKLLSLLALTFAVAFAPSAWAVRRYTASAAGSCLPTVPDAPYQVLNGRMGSQGLVMQCAVNLGPATVLASDLAYVHLWVIDWSVTRNFSARLCFKDMVNDTTNCGAFAYSSGSGANVQALSLAPPASSAGIALMGYLEVSYPYDNTTSAVLGYGVYDIF